MPRPLPRRRSCAPSRSGKSTALVWGPLAGYFAARESPPLAMTPLAAAVGDLPFEFAIAMGVRRHDQALRDRLNEVLERRAPEIDRILAEYHVPRVDGGGERRVR